METFMDLPDDVLVKHILPWLGTKSLVSLAQSCTDMQEVVLDLFKWKSIKVRLFSQKDLEEFAAFMRKVKHTDEVNVFQLTVGPGLYGYKSGLGPRQFIGAKVVRLFVGCDPPGARKRRRKLHFDIDVSALLADLRIMCPNVRNFWLQYADPEVVNIPIVCISDSLSVCSAWGVLEADCVRVSQGDKMRVVVGTRGVKCRLPASIALAFARLTGCLIVKAESALLRGVDEGFQRLAVLDLKCGTLVMEDLKHLPEHVFDLRLKVWNVQFSPGVVMPGVSCLSLSLSVAAAEGQDERPSWSKLVEGLRLTFPNATRLELNASAGGDAMVDRWLYPLGKHGKLRILTLAGFTGVSGGFLHGDRFSRLWFLHFKGCPDILEDVIKMAKNGKPMDVKIYVYPRRDGEGPFRFI